jgi:hypothetical protein
MRVSAYLSPDGGNLTLVLLNADSKDHLVAVAPGAFPYGALTAYRTSGDAERVAPVPFEADGSLALPARSIATVTFTP